MKALILAAGKGTRMYPLTLNTPKLLIKILNKTLLEYLIESLDGLVNDVIIVVDKSTSAEKIKEYVLKKQFPIKIKFAEQKEPLGTAHAILSAKAEFSKKNERFIVMNGDDIYSRIDILEALKYEYAVVGKQVSDPEKWGILVTSKNGDLVKLVEKPQKNIGNLANIGLYVINSGIFELYDKVKLSVRKEYEITDLISLFAVLNKVKVTQLKGYWIPIGYPWHILEASSILCADFNYKILGTIEENVNIKGRLELGKGSIIKSGCYIEGDVVVGKNTIIGPGTYLRGVTVLGNNCKIGSNIEIKNSVINDNVKIAHLTYLGDSIVGEGASIGGGTIIDNDSKYSESGKTVIKNELIDSGRKKLGAIIGDGARISSGTLILPGRKLGPNIVTMPGEIISKDNY